MPTRPDEQVRIIDLHEREARTFPREEFFDSRGKSLLLPETRDLSAVDLRDVLDGIELRVLGLIGYLPLTSSIVLNIRPKFPLKNLWEMLKSSDETYEKVLPIFRFYESANLIAPHKMLARGFCHYLSKILDTGVVRGYYSEEYRGQYLPKVNFGATIARYLSRGDDVNVISDVFKFSSNLYVNRLLKAACIAFLRVIPRSDQWKSDRMLIIDALNALYPIAPVKMLIGDQNRTRSLPVWVRDAYNGAFTIYAILLGDTKVGFSFDARGSEMPSFLFSLDKIFESFIRNTIRDGLLSHNYSVLDGNIPRHQQSLFSDNKRYPIKPDLIFRDGKLTMGLGEVKYKPKIDEGDRYQLISHVIAHSAPFGVWISPSTDGGGGLEYIGSMSPRYRFYHYRLNIADDLNEACRIMIQDIISLIKLRGGILGQKT